MALRDRSDELRRYLRLICMGYYVFPVEQDIDIYQGLEAIAGFCNTCLMPILVDHHETAMVMMYMDGATFYSVFHRTCPVHMGMMDFFAAGRWHVVYSNHPQLLLHDPSESITLERICVPHQALIVLRMHARLRCREMPLEISCETCRQRSPISAMHRVIFDLQNEGQAVLCYYHSECAVMPIGGCRMVYSEHPFFKM